MQHKEGNLFAYSLLIIQKIVFLIKGEELSCWLHITIISKPISTQGTSLRRASSLKLSPFNILTFGSSDGCLF